MGRAIRKSGHSKSGLISLITMTASGQRMNAALGMGGEYFGEREPKSFLKMVVVFVL